MTDSTLISYITDSREVVDHTPIGTVIVNYLLETKSDPNANVVYRLDDDTYESLYSYDLLQNTLADIVQDHLLIVRDTFGSPADALASLLKLQNYLENSNATFFEEAEMLAKVRGYISTLQPSKKRHGERVVTRPNPHIVKSVRNGIGNSTPILTDVKIINGRQTRPILSIVRPVPVPVPSRSFVPSINVMEFSSDDDDEYSHH